MDYKSDNQLMRAVDVLKAVKIYKSKLRTKWKSIGNTKSILILSVITSYREQLRLFVYWLLGPKDE